MVSECRWSPTTRRLRIRDRRDSAPGSEIRIVDPAGTELERGLDGEVVLRGPNVMRGYLGHPEESATAIVDGWLHTGDVGHLDADGYLTLVGRSKDMIIRGGENIYPREIEEVLAGDPSVLEAAVIGVPDPNGERWSSPMSRLGPVTPSTSWHSKPGVPKPSAVNLG